ncbi:unnamed protein product [Diamesa serratosioi]
MSLIKKIVEIVDKNEGMDARKNISKLNKDIKSYKQKVNSYITTNYIEFLFDIGNNEHLIDEGDLLKDELSNFQENLQNETKNKIYSAHDELSKHIEELEESELGLNISMKLMKIDTLLQKINQLNESENYAKINRVLTSINILINDPNDKIIRRLEMYKNLKLRLLQEQEKMVFNLEKRFSEIISMKEKSFPNMKSVTITVSKNSTKIVDTVNALIYADYDLSKVTMFLMDNVFEPIISRAVSLEINQNEKEFLLNLSYSMKPVTDELRPNYKVIFDNLKQTLQFLVNMNIQLVNNQTKQSQYLLEMMFQTKRDDLFEVLFNDCIIHAIPETIEEKENSTLMEDILKLNDLFIEINFFDGNVGATVNCADNKLKSYAQNVEDLFNKQFSKNILASSSELLKRDLHDMILVSEESSAASACNSPLIFPRSMISKSTIDFIKLLDRIIHQANGTENELSKNLFASIASALENYSFTIQLHHSKFLSKIPQQSALFYNNCMYLSHWISTNQEIENQNFENVAKTLQEQGLEIFDCQVAKQKIQLLEILKDYDLSSSLNNLLPEHFKPVRQCLRQMDLLKNVWQTILPMELYSNTIGNLLDVLCSDLARKICIMEDISTTLSTGLVDLIKVINEKGTLLFEETSHVNETVPNWQRLMNLQFILDASLVGITESWKSGTLSQNLKAEEVKHLLRALFQNTDRRANALSLIV